MVLELGQLILEFQQKQGNFKHMTSKNEDQRRAIWQKIDSLIHPWTCKRMPKTKFSRFGTIENKNSWTLNSTVYSPVTIHLTQHVSVSTHIHSHTLDLVITSSRTNLSIYNITIFYYCIQDNRKIIPKSPKASHRTALPQSPKLQLLSVSA